MALRSLSYICFLIERKYRKCHTLWHSFKRLNQEQKKFTWKRQAKSLPMRSEIITPLTFFSNLDFSDTIKYTNKHSFFIFKHSFVLIKDKNNMHNFKVIPMDSDSKFQFLFRYSNFHGLMQLLSSLVLELLLWY